MDDDSRKLMLIAGAFGIFFFGVWTLFLVFVALMAESGGKNPNPVLALLLLWPLAELIWSWIWIARHGDRYLKSRRLRLGNSLFVIALLLPPLFLFGMIFSETKGPEWLFSLSMAITIVCCHAARWLWSRAENGKAPELLP